MYLSEILTTKPAHERAQLKGLEIAKICRGCGTSFENKNPRIKPSHFSKKVFCLKRCAYENRGGSKNSNWRGGKEKAECEKCGKDFEYRLTVQRGRFCSFECAKINAPFARKKTLLEIVCASCNEIFSGYIGRIYCSKKCVGAGMTGEKHRNYKGGVLNKQYHHRKRKALVRGALGSHTQKEWEELKNMYDNMCICCKRSEPEILLTLDHIVPITKGGTDFIENIQPLCGSCNSRKYVSIINFRTQYEQV